MIKHILTITLFLAATITVSAERYSMRQLDPQTITDQEIQELKTVYVTSARYDSGDNPNESNFETAITLPALFKLLILAAYCPDGTLAGWVTASKIDFHGKPVHLLAERYTLPQERTLGVENALIKETLQLSHDGMVLAVVGAICTYEHNFLEKHGFVRIYNSNHPDGRGISFIAKLFEITHNPLNPQDFVCYYKEQSN